MLQSFFRELRGVFLVKSNVCDGGFFDKITKGFYALTVFAEKLSRGCSTGIYICI